MSRCSTTSPRRSDRAAGCACTSARTRSARASSRSMARSQPGASRQRASSSTSRSSRAPAIASCFAAVRRSAPSAAASSRIRSRHGARARSRRSDDRRRLARSVPAGSRSAGVDLAELPVRLGVGASRARRAARARRSGWRVGRRAYAASARESIARQILDDARRTSRGHTRSPAARRGSGFARRFAHRRPRWTRSSTRWSATARSSVEQGEVWLADFAAATLGSAAGAGGEADRPVAAGGVEPPSLEELAAAMWPLANGARADLSGRSAREGTLVAVET